MREPPERGPEPSKSHGSLDAQSSKAGDRRAGPRWAGFLVFLFGLALYIGTVGYDFIWDDHALIEHNQFITNLRYLPRFFTDDLTQLTSGAMHGPYYRPLYWTSLLLDFLVWGLRPAGFHLTNALLHALAGWLVFRLARSLLGDPRPALLAALLFAAHPTHVKTIAMASARNEPMAAIGVLLAVLWYHRAHLGGGEPRRGTALGSLAAFVFALLSKETAISLPLTLVWAEVVSQPDASRGREGRLRGTVVRLVPYFAVSLALLWFRWGVVAHWTSATIGTGTILGRIPGSLELVARYVILALLPVRLQPWYDLPRPTGLLAAWPLAGLGLVLLAGGLALWWRRRCPVASFGLGWFLIALSPVLDLVPVADRGMSFATRYLFVSTIGLALLAGAGLTRLFPGRVERASEPGPATNARSPVRVVAVAASAVVLIGWTIGTLTYLPVFQDDLRLFARVARDVPGLAFGHRNLGLALLRAGRYPEGLQALERAVAAEPHNRSARLALASSYVASGRTAEALRLLDDMTPWIEEDYIYLRTRAAAYLGQKEWHAAAEIVSRGLRRYPDVGDLHFLLGYALEGLGDLPRAEGAYRRALELYPAIPGGRLALAHLLIREGRPAEAAALARGALRQEPHSPAAWRALALALEAWGDAPASRQAWERVLELDQAPAARAEARRHLSPIGGPAGPSPTKNP